MKLIVKLLGTKLAKSILLAVAEELSNRTDNTIDDAIVSAVKKHI